MTLRYSGERICTLPQAGDPWLRDTAAVIHVSCHSRCQEGAPQIENNLLWGEALLTSVITSASEHLSVLRSGPVALDVAG